MLRLVYLRPSVRGSAVDATPGRNYCAGNVRYFPATCQDVIDYFLFSASKNYSLATDERRLAVLPLWFDRTPHGRRTTCHVTMRRSRDIVTQQ